MALDARAPSPPSRHSFSVDLLFALRAVPGRYPTGEVFLSVLRTTDHKTIGRMYLVTAFAFFMLAGAMAMLMRAGTIVFATYAGIYFWFPKFTGRYLDERLGKLHFWLTFVGFHATFLVMHLLGERGMPRRVADYRPDDGFTTLNTVATIGSFVLGASILPFLWNVYRSYRFGERTTADDPWGFGNSLEWATSSPPPRHNFTSIPRIRSERPAFEAHYPQYCERLEVEASAKVG